VKSLVKPPRATKNSLIDRAIEFWQPRRRRDLTVEDARQIVENVTGFFGILSEWSRAEISAPTNDTSEPGADGIEQQ
jgi:hypothetical protein